MQKIIDFSENKKLMKTKEYCENDYNKLRKRVFERKDIIDELSTMLACLDFDRETELFFANLNAMFCLDEGLLKTAKCSRDMAEQYLLESLRAMGRSKDAHILINVICRLIIDYKNLDFSKEDYWYSHKNFIKDMMLGISKGGGGDDEESTAL